MLKRLWLTALLSALFSHSAFANDRTQQTASDVGNTGDLSVMIFVAKNVRGFQSYPFKSTTGDQDLFGASAAWTPIDLPYRLKAGIDGGIAIRDDGNKFTQGGTSGEFWVGPTLRHEGISLGPILVKLSATVGLSGVTDSKGLERERELEYDGSAAIIYYAGPEVGLSLKSFPQADFVYRFHHRSGAKNVGYLPTLGGVGDVSNVNLFGIRYHF